MFFISIMVLAKKQHSTYLKAFSESFVFFFNFKLAFESEEKKGEKPSITTILPFDTVSKFFF